MNTKTKKIIYWTLTVLVAVVFAGSALGKLSGSGQAAEMAKGLGGSKNLMPLAITELIIAALWLFPKTGVLASLLAIAYFGGAMAVHFVNNQPVLVPAIIQIFIWAAAAYRFPELTKRLFSKQQSIYNNETI